MNTTTAMDKLKEQAFDWSSISSGAQLGVADCPILSRSSIPSSVPNFENQISSPEHPYAVEFFEQFHLPMIRDAGIEPNRTRILEIGSGLGWLSYGTLNSITPETYIATDVFPQLVPILSNNLKKWATTDTKTGAAFFNPEDFSFFKANFFNVIQSHSVLHHVLDYRQAVKALYEHLASPGILLFCEPCLEGYLFLLTTVRMFVKTEHVPDELLKQMAYLETYVLQRTGAQRNDKDFLSQFGTGDKYLYSAYDLLDLAQTIGAKLYVKKDGRSLKESLKYELKIRGADELMLMKFDNFLSRLLPYGIENAYFSDLRQVFCYCKNV